MLKFWDYEMELTGKGASQFYLGHCNKINQCLFLPDQKRLLSVGGFEGIYEWQFNGDLTPAERTVSVAGLVPYNTKKIRVPKKKKKRANKSP
jgi:hypothetical protein